MRKKSMVLCLVFHYREAISLSEAMEASLTRGDSSATEDTRTCTASVEREREMEMEIRRRRRRERRRNDEGIGVGMYVFTWWGGSGA